MKTTSAATSTANNPHLAFDPDVYNAISEAERRNPRAFKQAQDKWVTVTIGGKRFRVNPSTIRGTSQMLAMHPTAGDRLRLLNTVEHPEPCFQFAITGDIPSDRYSHAVAKALAEFRKSRDPEATTDVFFPADWLTVRVDGITFKINPFLIGN